MPRLSILLLMTLVMSCNVFQSLDGVELSEDANDANNANNANNAVQVCDDDCTCSSDCEIDCSDCAIMCESGADCSGQLGDGGAADCAQDATCEIGCTDGSCEFSCTHRDSDCFVDCGEGVECLLDCGDNRNPPRRNDCVFVNCDNPTECSEGLFVCNRDCPQG